MKLINFDEMFNDYFTEWFAKNAKKFGNEEELENQMPILYSEWIQTKNSSINNLSPLEFFKQISAKEKVEMLMAYLRSDEVPLCDLVCDSIIGDGKACESFLFENLKTSKTNEERAVIMNLLGDVNSELPLNIYVEWIKDQNFSQELKEIAADIISSNKDFSTKVIPSLMKNINKANYQEKELIADIASNAEGSEEAFNFLISMFKSGEDVALFGAYLGKFGDVRALKYLEEEIKRDDINYVEFMEIRNSIESLGGVVPENKVFENDPLYQKIKNVSQE